jgi:hemin uptake protein HemP
MSFYFEVPPERVAEFKRASAKNRQQQKMAPQYNFSPVKPVNHGTHGSVEIEHDGYLYILREDHTWTKKSLKNDS